MIDKKIDVHLLDALLKKLSEKRPVFYSEADFQHALAWEIHQKIPESSIRLEFKPPHLTEHLYLDIWADNHTDILAIELKYKTKRTRINLKGEDFDLLNHGAHDVSRYDFLKDIRRLEKTVETNEKITGYAIFLTNDSLYWMDTRRSVKAADDAFRIHQGITLSGRRSWAPGAAKGTIKGRERPLILKGRYSFLWNDYSSLVRHKYGYFRYVLVKIPHQAAL
jgi:hypothetical protein